MRSSSMSPGQLTHEINLWNVPFRPCPPQTAVREPDSSLLHFLSKADQWDKKRSFKKFL